MSRFRSTFMISLIMILTILFAGCGQSNVQVGWTECTLSGHWQASYVRFSGAETQILCAQTAQILTIEYEVDVNKGDLTIVLMDQLDEILWDIYLQEDAHETVKVPLPQAGRYALIVQGNDTGGGFDLSWELN